MTASKLFQTNYGTHKAIIRFRNEGANSEGIDVRGTSHLMEHLLCDPMMHFMDDMERFGIRMNAFTSAREVAFWLSGLNKYMPQFINRWADAVMSLKPVDEAGFKKEQNIVMEELKMYYSDPVGGVLTNFIGAHYDWLDAGGSIDAVKKFSYEQYRERLRDFAVATDVIEIGATSLLNIPELNKTRAPRQVDNGVTYFREPNRDNIEPLTISRTVGGIHFPKTFTRESHEYYVLDLLMDSLNGNWKSPFWHRIREEKGLTYTPGYGKHAVCGEKIIPMFHCDTSTERGKELRDTYQSLLDEMVQLLTEDRFELNKQSNIITYETALLNEPSALYQEAMHEKSYQDLIVATEKVTFQEVHDLAVKLQDIGHVFLSTDGYEG